MNYFPSPRVLVLCAAWLAACGAPASESEAGDARYGLEYSVTASPANHSVAVELQVSQRDDLLREMRFDANPERYSAFEADGELSVIDGRVTWSPPDSGGSLRWRVLVPNRRRSGGHDAWLDESWGLFRAEDIIPRAATRTLIGVTSETSIKFSLPDQWSAVTEYMEIDGQFRVRKDERRFAQPSGWIVMGKLGVRRERIAGTRVAIAAPENQGTRRMDMLALLNWTMPELARMVPTMPRRLTVVSAAEPMWRGGLSAPQSIFIHADRPLISENGTSTLLHEVVHVALASNAARDFDWIVEGLAEYYSLQLLRRSGSITASRFANALLQLSNWAKSADSLCAESSTGAATALAVTILAALDQEIREETGSKKSLDDVLRLILQTAAPLNLESLTKASIDVLGQNPDTLHINNLPGCRSIPASSKAAS